MHSRMKPIELGEKKPAFVQPAWRRSSVSTTGDVRKPGFVSKPSTLVSQSKQNVDVILKDLVIKSPAKPFYDENNVFVNNTLLESPPLKNPIFSSPAGNDDGYITANELSASKATDGSDPFNSSFNYSIRKSGCWSGSSTPKYRDIPNRPSASPSAQQTAAKSEVNSLRAENERLTMVLKEKDAMISAMMNEMEAVKFKFLQSEAVMKIALDQTSQKLMEIEDRRKMAWEEVNAMNFLIGLQEQKIGEGELKIMKVYMDCNDKLSEKSKKHKQIVAKLKVEREEYEKRASSMITQTTEQMTLLQTFAMERITTLESDVISLRRANSELTDEVASLKAAAQEAAEREEEVESSYNAIPQVSTLDISNEWTSPPAKFSRPNVNKRRSSAMFHGSGPSINFALHNKQPVAKPTFDIPTYEEEDVDGNSDEDTVVDEHEAEREGDMDGEEDLEYIVNVCEEDYTDNNDDNNNSNIVYEVSVDEDYGHNDWKL